MATTKNTFGKKLTDPIVNTLTEIAQEGFNESAAEQKETNLQQDQEGVLVLQEQSIPVSQIDDYIDRKLAEKEHALEERFHRLSQSITIAEPARAEPLSPKKVESADELPEFDNWEERDRIYILCTGYSSISHGIRDRHKKNSPLMYKGRSLRYSTSQASFFMDQQKGDTLITYLQIEEGKLFVPKENAHLQKFLAIHPDLDIVFKEHNPKAESKAIYDVQNLKLDAHILSREIEFAALEAIAMLMCKDYLETWDPYTVKRQLYLEIESNPKLFIKLANDKTLKLKAIGKIAVNRGLIGYENYRFTDDKGTFLCESNRNENEYDALASYFSTNEGRNIYEYLVHKIEK